MTECVLGSTEGRDLVVSSSLSIGLPQGPLIGRKLKALVGRDPVGYAVGGTLSHEPSLRAKSMPRKGWLTPIYACGFHVHLDGRL